MTQLKTQNQLKKATKYTIMGHQSNTKILSNKKETLNKPTQISTIATTQI